MAEYGVNRCGVITFLNLQAAQRAPATVTAGKCKERTLAVVGRKQTLVPHATMLAPGEVITEDQTSSAST